MMYTLLIKKRGHSDGGCFSKASSHAHKRDVITILSLRPIISASILWLARAAVYASSKAVPLHAISIDVPRGLLENPLTRITIDDVRQLLRAGFPTVPVRLNNSAADVHIVLPAIDQERQGKPSPFALHHPYDYLPYPEHSYEWISSRESGRIICKLITPSCQGVSFGLYGLLQEKLGFKFYHPKRTLIPFHDVWPLTADFRWKAIPRFDKKGFHLHTLHPIELTEQIHNPDYPHAAAEVKEYIDWLARNQQNTFQFYLLRGVDRDRWLAHAEEFVAYAHRRGILMGVEFSLSSIQQRAFTAVHLLKFFPSYRHQIDEALSWLFRVKWDFVSVDFTMGEYLPDIGRICPSLREYIVKRITNDYGTKMFFATHVIPDNNKKAPKNAEEIQPAQPYKSYEGSSLKTGILIHTVMCYSLSESYAPVYGNINQRHMLARARIENQMRETWYWPESSYWVAFDNSVPLFLLSYLETRLSDMEALKKLGVDNHLTFSSGWEWGYWLVDWSIARWSWRHIEGEREKPVEPLAMIRDLFPDQRIFRAWHAALTLQNQYFKELRLMPFLSALDPSSELPWPFNRPFQPRLPFSYQWLLHSASDAEADEVLRGPVTMLVEYAEKANTLVTNLRLLSKQDYHVSASAVPEGRVLLDGLINGLELTALRAEHRALTIRALIAKKNEASEKSGPSEQYLAEAASKREQALSLVHQEESMYRYPVELIARRRKDFTSYQFGYLYPASDLFFWYREEQQIRNYRLDGFYMNIWDFGKLLSIESLFG